MMQFQKSSSTFLRFLITIAQKFFALFSPYNYEFSSEFVSRWKTKNPSSYREKVQYKMARDRREIITLFADKLEARNYVENLIGPSVLPRVYFSGGNPELLPWSDFPREFVIKVNHASKGIIVVTQKVPLQSQLPKQSDSVSWTGYFLHPDNLNHEAIISQLKTWLSTSYNWSPKNYSEWAYSKIPRGLIVEEYLAGEKILAENLKVHCFNGKAATILFSDLNSDFHENVSYKFLVSELRIAEKLSGISYATLKKFVKYSEILSQETDMVRVDWLITKYGLKFSELTNYPSAGLADPSASYSLTAQEINDLYFNMWQLPVKYF